MTKEEFKEKREKAILVVLQKELPFIMTYGWMFRPVINATFVASLLSFLFFSAYDLALLSFAIFLSVRFLVVYYEDTSIKKVLMNKEQEIISLIKKHEKED